MEPKRWYLSKTLWFNILTAIGTVLGALNVDVGLDEKTKMEIVVGVLAAANIVLRIVTKVPLGKA